MRHREMDETLLKEYFKQDMVAPSYLVQKTVLKIKKRDTYHLLLITALSCSIILIAIFICLLIGPFPLIYKLGLFMMYGLTQGTVAIWAMHRNSYLQDEYPYKPKVS